MAWSTSLVLLSAAWLVGVLPHPFSDADLALVGGVLHLLPPMVGTITVLAIGILGSATSLVLRRVAVGALAATMPRTGVIAAWALAGFSGLVLLHGRFLSFLGYTPVVLVRGWFDAELRAAFVAQLDTDLVVVCLAAVGALLWAAAAVVTSRKARAACHGCGRRPGWTDVDEAHLRRRMLRIGRVAVAAGITAASIYPAIRLPWAFGVGFGLDAATWAELSAVPGAVATGLGLAAAGAVGAALMLGLVQDWGVRFPRWMVGLHGRRVPPLLAVVPASIVALALTASGRGWLIAIAAGRLPDFGDGMGVQLVAMLSFLPWGLALAVATAAYALRRRGSCNRCERGAPEALPSTGA